MKRFLIIGSICLAFLAGAAMTAVAQDDHNDHDRQDDHAARPQDERHDEARKDEHARQDERARQDEYHDQAREEHGRRIDDAHFREHFGRNHHFVIHHVEMVEGRPHFAYGGYNFVVVQPWPGGWSYNDDCYIDYVDGAYYLFNLRHPGVRVAVEIL
jgi:hypothetical protein